MNTLSKDQYKRLAKPKRHKYSAKKTRDLDGVECPSWLHAEVANELIWRRNQGEIRFSRESAVRLKDKCGACGAGAITYKVDFCVVTVTDMALTYVEAKGAEVASFRKRKKLWKEVGPAPLEIYKARYRQGQCIPYLAETIYPKQP